MLSLNMTTTMIRDSLAERGDRVDTERYVQALTYVRDDGRRRRI
mgnify:CR=1 FL=1